MKKMKLSLASIMIKEKCYEIKQENITKVLSFEDLHNFFGNEYAAAHMALRRSALPPDCRKKHTIARGSPARDVRIS